MSVCSSWSVTSFGVDARKYGFFSSLFLLISYFFLLLFRFTSQAYLALSDKETRLTYKSGLGDEYM